MIVTTYLDEILVIQLINIIKVVVITNVILILNNSWRLTEVAEGQEGIGLKFDLKAVGRMDVTNVRIILRRPDLGVLVVVGPEEGVDDGHQLVVRNDRIQVSRSGVGKDDRHILRTLQIRFKLQFFQRGGNENTSKKD